MKKILNFMIVLVLGLFVLPNVLAVSVGNSPDIEINVNSSDLAPEVWSCANRVIFDDATGPGRFSPDGAYMFERMENYAFEGEQIGWTVLVRDLNGVEDITGVYGTIGLNQGEDNDREVTCQLRNRLTRTEFNNCNLEISFAEYRDASGETFEAYECLLTVETPVSMWGEHWLTVEAVDSSELSGTMVENEYWFLNPEIALNSPDDLAFDDVKPGTSSYSNTLLIGNRADPDSGVLLDMFISGTDFYDSSSSGAMCGDTNQLSLTNFKYKTTNGAYSSSMDPRADNEGYVGIGYGIGFNDPHPFYNVYEILQTPLNVVGYHAGNILSPGSEMAITFRLDLPSPCNGNFDEGNIYFWGEAI